MPVDMAEEVQLELDLRHSLKQFLGTVMDIVVKVKNAIWRGMGYQDIDIRRDVGIIARLSVSDAIAHEHWDAIELHSIDGHAGVAEIMDVLIESVNLVSVKTFIMVAADKYLMHVRQVAKPVQEVQSLLLGADHAEVAGMHHHIGLG